MRYRGGRRDGDLAGHGGPRPPARGGSGGSATTSTADAQVSGNSWQIDGRFEVRVRIGLRYKGPGSPSLGLHWCPNYERLH